MDWLGRGGIAQLTATWAIELDAMGHDVVVVTREGRELGDELRGVISRAASGNPVRAHRRVATTAARVIGEQRPDIVIFQNYVLPLLELPAHRAAWARGSRVVIVAHDDRLHSPLAGTRVGLPFLMRRAERVVAHTEFVARSIRRVRGVSTLDIVPLPAPLVMLPHRAVGRPPSSLPPRVAVHFGVLKRRYKGTATVVELARSGVPGWDFLLIGTGAPQIDGIRSVPGFVQSAELTRMISEARCCLLPYERATQSGAVVLAQALGCVPVASAVGGIPEQIIDGVTGLLLPHGSSPAAWRQALARLDDDAAVARMREAAAAAVRTAHDEFVRYLHRLTGPAGATAKGVQRRAQAG